MGLRFTVCIVVRYVLIVREYPISLGDAYIHIEDSIEKMMRNLIHVNGMLCITREVCISRTFRSSQLQQRIIIKLFLAGRNRPS
jgi:hypothetical protein